MSKFFKGLVVLMVSAFILSFIAACEPDEKVLLGGMNLYYGNLHSHTGYSDGEGTPDDAYKWARDTAKMDFYAITDHAESMTLSEWSDTGKKADLYNEDSRFAAIRGFEWGHPYWGHMNVFNTSSYEGCITIMKLADFYTWIDENDGLGQYNHPSTQPGTYDDFRLYPELINNMFSFETGNSGDTNYSAIFLGDYIRALDNGWKVGASYNIDNHSLSDKGHRTVLISKELTRESMLDAMRQRKMYSTDDPNLRVIFKSGLSWMGSDVKAVNNQVQLTAYASDDEPILSMAIYTNDGKVAQTRLYLDSRTKAYWTLTLPVTSNNTYFFLRVITKNTLDGGADEQVAITSPIWVSID